MDSKLRRMAISASLAVILLVSILVIYTNKETGTRQIQTGASAENQPESTKQPGTLGENGGGGGTSEGGQAPKENGQIGNDLSAFLRDDSFFDEEVNPVLEAAKNNANKLSLIMTSVEKDLRIQIVDAEGEPVTGESFYVNLKGMGDYKDLDQDGVIYIGDLKAGEYNVTLLPMTGYKVPADEMKIRVKDRVEYLAIDDISLLMKTEDEVDAGAEDTSVQEALADADKSEVTKLQPAGNNARVGIDVSKWNGEIDWDKTKKDGVEFAIVRAGYRGSVSGALVVDPYFHVNMKAASASGVPTGVYFFTQAVNEVEAVEEASAVLQLVEKYDLEYPIYIDTEGAGGNGRADGLDAETRTLVCEAFCRTIQNAGYAAGVYASRNWLNNNLQMDRLDQYLTWLAEYRSVPLYQGYYQMWQYTSKGQIDGIRGNVDINISYE